MKMCGLDRAGSSRYGIASEWASGGGSGRLPDDQGQLGSKTLIRATHH